MSIDPERRRFLGVLAVTTAAAVSLPFVLRGTRPVVAADAPRPQGGSVTIDEFSPDKKPLGPRTEARVVMTDEQWRQKLDGRSYYVMRHEGTEPPYTGPGWDRHENGIYRCLGCDTALYDSATKFDSGTGWPSFWQPISKRNIVQTDDRSLAVEDRTAVSCARCGSHLGHVFDDGPDPTGLRYCMNAVAMKFVPVPGVHITLS
ncbi:peptide-methionine (R)-S-oxide reductase MsrB [Luteibacter aegosomatis]|uniref:peptide-methionine (R)-S-oxide reductase MsrB n=1 Tax=Luteibacter aegosomatis TaxID=2911537 RepID=UPI001FF95BBD|nr:peptide-methionine (R)-S-oxide reductase MsrB [Luteibacter aegosomatis]UPG86433.1 peptide-methionine (R)-S-oxide reductase MsrB [Luteibacter aegosomatis]